MHSSGPRTLRFLSATSWAHAPIPWFPAIVLTLSLVGCAKGGSDDGLGGAGGTFATNATIGNVTSNTSTSISSTATGTGDPLTDSCTADCQVVASVTAQLSCSPTPDCVNACVADGQGAGPCKDLFVALNQCAKTSIDTTHCYCDPDTGILDCNLCPSQVGAYQNCIAQGTD